jgi:hypothetical protein
MDSAGGQDTSGEFIEYSGEEQTVTAAAVPSLSIDVTLLQLAGLSFPAQLPLHFKLFQLADLVCITKL